MQIILFRHSIAEKLSEAIDDYDRDLTEKGISRAEKKAELVKGKLGGKENIVIWTSPLRRAERTAGVLGKILGCEKIEIKDYIAFGDIDDLKRDIQMMQDNDLVIVVGHNPYLDIWCGKITGEQAKLRKAGFVWIELGSSGQLHGKIKLESGSRI